jgi:hypothetical protein
LDYFVKDTLKERYYLRYCDDFVILKRKKKPLEKIKAKIEDFLKEDLHLRLNWDKTRIISTNRGLDLLGYKVYYFYKLLRRKNVKAFKQRLYFWQERLKEKRLSSKDLIQRIRGWCEYARYGNSYKLRKKLFKDVIFNTDYHRINPCCFLIIFSCLFFIFIFPELQNWLKSLKAFDA